MTRAPGKHRRPLVATGSLVFEALGVRSLSVLAVSALVSMAIAGCRDDADSLASPGEKPNVLLITLDTTRADFLGCYGRPTARTPNLDRLAREGTRFAQCSTCTSLTAPSHASILTGQYPFVHGVRTNGSHRLASGCTTLAEVLRTEGYRTHAILAASVLNDQFGLNQGFDEYDNVPIQAANKAVIAQRRGDEISEHAIAFLGNQQGEPFLLWLHYYDPHHPYLSPRSNATTIERYEDEITFMDDQIGRVLTELRRRAIDNRTLIVVVGDHGEGLGDHGESGHGYFAYESTLHVPCIFWYPSLVAANHVVDMRVRTIDLAPTVLALIQAPGLPDAQGENLGAMLQRKTQQDVPAAYAEAFEAYYHFGLSPIRTLSTNEWKFVLAPRRELFRISQDPAEKGNVLSEHADVAAGLYEQMRSLIADAPDPPSTDESEHRPGMLDRAALESLGYVGAAETGTAEAHLREIDRLEPQGNDPRDFTETLESYIQARHATGEQDDDLAVELLEKVVGALPTSVRPRADFAHACQRKGQHEEARKQYEEALRLDPDSHYTRQMYAGLFMESKQWALAEEQFRILIASDPTDGESWYNMGIALASLHRPDEAREHLKQAASVDPRDPRPWNALGVLCVQGGQYDEAVGHFQHALRIDPKHDKSRRDLERALKLVEQSKGP
ncbi:MAG: sulfatase-like hydrolase/transferase [Phycisphaerae bacterium]|nr:sulfatase-like hydrolase/transferase [Phycisphaerae bacterium]